MPMYGKRSTRSRELPGSIGHVVLAQDSAGNSAVFGPFATSEAAEAFTRHANKTPGDGYQYTALFLISPGRHRAGGQ